MSGEKSLFRVIAEPLIVAVTLAAVVRAAIGIYAIPSGSMMPSLQTGDHIVVTPYRFGGPQRGDVIVFRAPGNPSTLMAKRIVGMPGERIEGRGGRVRVDERTIAEPYLLKQAATGGITAQTVPAGSYFVMGDNREDSADSRVWGSVGRELIVGRVRMVFEPFQLSRVLLSLERSVSYASNARSAR